MSLYLGFAGYFSLRLCEDPVRAEAMAGLCLDSRWPWPLTSVVFELWAAHWSSHSQRSRLSRKREGHLRLKEGFLDPEYREASLDHRVKETRSYARLVMETGQRFLEPSFANPAEITGWVKDEELQGSNSVLPWTDVMHQILLTLEVANAVICAWPTAPMAYADVSLGGTEQSSPFAARSSRVRRMFGRNNERAHHWRAELGDQYIRHPRWGTYLRRAHLDRVGGLERIRGEVPLAKVLELGGAGDLVYLQCTEHPAGALTPEGEQIRQKLEDVFEPIVAPARPHEQQPAG